MFNIFYPCNTPCFYSISFTYSMVTMKCPHRLQHIVDSMRFMVIYIYIWKSTILTIIELKGKTDITACKDSTEDGEPQLQITYFEEFVPIS